MPDTQGAHEVITFYSYKGGTGRSMALANVAWILASNGSRVLVVDWDLEAPGLHRYFQPFIVDGDLVDTDGLIDYMWSVTSAIMSGSVTQGALQKSAFPDLLDYAICIDWPFPDGGSLDFIPAGRQGTNYPQRVNSFDWGNFYERLDGAKVLRSVRDRLRKAYDYVLIDSRTGVSDTAGICTVQMPDALVGFFTMNNQSIEGVAAVLDSALALRSKTGEGRLRVYPVVSRVEDGEQDKLEASRSRYREVFSRFVDSSRGSVREYWDDMEIPYKKFFAYEEVLATFGDYAGARGSQYSLLSAIERLTRRITRIDELSMPEVEPKARQAILARYANPESQVQEPVVNAPPTLLTSPILWTLILGTVLIALVVSVVRHWPAATLTTKGGPTEAEVVRMVFSLGAAGASLTALRSLIALVRNRKVLKHSWIANYLGRPLIGALIGVVGYVGLRTFVAPAREGMLPASLNLITVYSMVAVAGLFAGQIGDKFSNTLSVHFGPDGLLSKTNVQPHP
jgi:cellulose biosynthesis protein BcsQ